MPDPTLFRTAHEALDPGTDFLKALEGTLRADPDGGLDRFLRFLTDRESPGDLPIPIDAALAEGLRIFAARIGIHAEHREALERLAGPISELPVEGLGWSWATEPSISIPAESIALEVSLATDLGARITPGSLVYRSWGDLRAGIGVTVPFQYGSFSASTKGRARAEVAFRFDHPADTKVYEALLLDLPRAVQLASPARMIEPRKESEFESAVLKTLGQVRLGAVLTAGRSWATAREVQVAGSRGSIALSASAGARYSIDWARTSEYELTVSSTESGRVHVRLDDAGEHSFKRALSIGANLKISGLDRVVTPLIERYSSLPPKLGALVDQLSRPRDRLAQKLGDLLRELPDEVRGLANVLAGSQEPDAFAEELSQLLTEIVDERVENWSELARGELDRFVTGALERLGVLIPSEGQPEVAGTLHELLSMASEALQREVHDRLRALLEQVRQPVVDALEDFGAKRDLALDRPDEAVREIIEPFQRLMERARGVRQKLLDAVEATTREELGLRFARTVQRTKRSEALLAFTLDPSSDDARRLYRRMLFGDFREALSVGLEGGRDDVALDEGLFERTLRYERTHGFTFDVFGLDVTGTNILTSDLQVDYDASGRITVCDSRATLERIRRAFGESQSARLTSGLQLVESRDPDALAALSLRLRYQDEDLEEEELAHFLALLERGGVLSRSSASGIRNSFDAGTFTHASGDRALAIEVSLALSVADLQRMVERTKQDREGVLRVAVIEQIRAWSNLGEMHLLEMLARRHPDLAGFVLGWRGMKPSERKVFDRVTHFKAQAIALEKRVEIIRENAESLTGFIEGIGQIWAIPLPRIDPLKPFPKEIEKAIEDRHRALVGELEHWMRHDHLIEGLFEIEDVSVWTVAFFRTLYGLAGESAVAVPIVSWADGRGRQRKVVFA